MSTCPTCGQPNGRHHRCTGAKILTQATNGHSQVPVILQKATAAPARHRYVFSVTPADAQQLESWLGFGLAIVPTEQHTGIPVAGLNAVTDAELAAVDARLRATGPVYHTPVGRHRG